jgi:pimeloyl-ACP methyl ester carboxylesterase
VLGVHRVTLQDEDEAFEVTTLEPAHASRVVLFAVGAGGNPERHEGLLGALATAGCRVVAPHFARLATPRVSGEELQRRARRLRLALAELAGELPVAGVGHSIGAATLIALAGGQAWMGPGAPVTIAREPRLDRLALLAPATGFFQAPGALDAVRVPVMAWAGTKDAVTPPPQAELLRSLSADVRVIADAGHFSFMDLPPPHAIETLPDRTAFLTGLAAEVCGFVQGARANALH